MLRTAPALALLCTLVGCGGQAARTDEQLGANTLRGGWSVPIGDDGLSLWDVAIVDNRALVVGTRPTFVDGVAAVDAIVRILDLRDGSVLFEEPFPVGAAPTRAATVSVRGTNAAALVGDSLILVDTVRLRARAALAPADATTVLLGDEAVLVTESSSIMHVYDAQSGVVRQSETLSGESVVAVQTVRGTPWVVTRTGAGRQQLIGRAATPGGLSTRWRADHAVSGNAFVLGDLLVGSQGSDGSQLAVRITDGRQVEIDDNAVSRPHRLRSLALDVVSQQGRLFGVQRISAFSPTDEEPVWTAAFVSGGTATDVVDADDGVPAMLVVASQGAAAFDTRDGDLLWEAPTPKAEWDSSACALEAFSSATFLVACNEGGMFRLVAVAPRVP